MIKSKRGTIEITGSAAEISADISTIIYAVLITLREKGYDDKKAKAFLDDAYQNGLDGDNVTKKMEGLDKLSDILDKLNDALDKLAEDEDWTKEEG